MSSSYGPGRSDLNYEEKGEDYPIAYVRFTENRNMESIVDLLESKRLIFSDLISHTFDLDEAPQAYDMILERTTPFSGILIQYDSELELKTSVHFNKNIKIDPTEANVGFIGAGNFAQNMLLPNIKDTCNFIGFTNSSVRLSKIPQIDFPDDITAVDWALFSTLMLTGVNAYFTGDTTTAYFVHEKSHCDLLADDLTATMYKARVKCQHYNYLRSIGFAFDEECKQNEVLLNKLTDETLCDFRKQKSFCGREYPLWWDLQTPIYEEKIFDV